MYDFTTIYERKGFDAIAVDHFGCPGFAPCEHYEDDDPRKDLDVIPMWIADMNFATAPSVVEAIKSRLSHPLFGYFELRDEYFNAIINWQKKRNGIEGLEKAHIGYENGVLGGVSAAARILTSPGGKILLNSPTYVGFTHSIGEYGFDLVLSDLVRDENGVWRMDFDDMEQKLREEHIHTAVFCSPHNPCGRVWERWEIEKVMALYRKYDVFVISDEIWSDMILEGHKHIPTQSVSEDAKMRTLAFYAPSKTFSLAGLVGSYHIVYNSMLRDRLIKESGNTHYNGANVLSMYALIGAFSEEGMRWTDELLGVLTENTRYAYTYIREHFNGVDAAKPEGTYMLYLDCEAWCKAHQKTMDELLQLGYDAKVAWQDGRPFHRPYAIRMNVALPTARVKEAFDRLDRFVFNA